MSEETTAARAETVRSNETARRISCTTDGFLVPSGELDCDLPVQQQDLGGLLRQVMSLFLLFLLVNAATIWPRSFFCAISMFSRANSGLNRVHVFFSSIQCTGKREDVTTLFSMELMTIFHATKLAVRKCYLLLW